MHYKVLIFYLSLQQNKNTNVLLTRLKNDGLLQYQWQESTQGPPRKYYALSKEGEQFLEGLDSSWMELSNTINYLKTITPKLLELKN